ncbi:MAG: thioredoxin domain-containing protein [Gemmatimonadota bacterium]
MNRLGSEKSPYLLQHAGNPVHWHPWSAGAFERARREDRPIFLSIGYSTCHWCHVMERESFVDSEVAALLNRGFVSVKVDREERPDVDGIYMTTCQMLTGSGGWPLTIVMTPDAEPFFAATYVPKHSVGGRIGLLDLLPRLEALWAERREEVRASSRRISDAVRRAVQVSPGAEPTERDLHDAFERLRGTFDPAFGGFGPAPRFPSPHVLGFLLRHAHRTGRREGIDMAVRTLEAMRRGGIWDQVGFGFHRYATDARWLLPHFEKMLYDQALLVEAHLDAFLASGREGLARTARDILTYVLRDLRDPDGGFRSAEDADSEGEEGRFYTWTAAQLAEVLSGEDLNLARRTYGVRDEGNFAEEVTGRRTGANVLHRLGEAQGAGSPDGAGDEGWRLEAIRRSLLAARERRVRPARDDKVLADWNGMAIGALARAARVLGEPDYLAAAREAASFVLGRMRDARGRLLHRYVAGDAAVDATASDYGFLARGLIELYETDFDPTWLREALGLAREAEAGFLDSRDGGFFVTAHDAESLLARVKDRFDGAVPSASSVLVEVFLRLSRLTGDAGLERIGLRAMRAVSADIGATATGQAHLLSAAGFVLGPSAEIVIVGDGRDPATRALLAAVRGRFLPYASVLLRRPGAGPGEIPDLAPFTRDLGTVGGVPTAWVCSGFTCESPVTDAAQLGRRLDAGIGVR